MLKGAQIPIPNRKRIRQILLARADSITKSILRTKLKQTRISIALDCWTSLNSNHAFLGIMGYFIDASWNYREVLLGFKHLV